MTSIYYGGIMPRICQITESEGTAVSLLAKTTPSEIDPVFNSPEYKRSRGAYIAQCTFEYFIAILVSDAYLAKLLIDIGISDTWIGVIESFASAAFLFQLVSLLLVRSVTSTKGIAIVLNSLSQLLFVGLYFIPFIPLPLAVKTVLVCACILLAYISQYAVSSMIYKWANSYVHPTKRGVYSATKEMISLITGMVFTFIAGQIIDRCEALDNLHAGFLFIAIAGLILSICNFVCMLLIKRDAIPKQTNSIPFSAVLRKILGNRSFRHVILLTCLWNFARFTTVGFMGTFKTKDLLLTVGTVQIINIIANLCRFFLSKPIGRFSDRTSFTRGIELALCIAAIGFAVNAFSSPSTWFCIVIYQIFYNVSIAGTNQNMNNIVYSYVPADYFVQASAIKNSIGGIVSLLSSLLGARILAAVQSNGNKLFGITLYGQQILSVLSFTVLIIAIVYVHFVLARKEVMQQ